LWWIRNQERNVFTVVIGQEQEVKSGCRRNMQGNITHELCPQRWQRHGTGPNVGAPCSTHESPDIGVPSVSFALLVRSIPHVSNLPQIVNRPGGRVGRTWLYMWEVVGWFSVSLKL
jgi:hypothetical protein